MSGVLKRRNWRCTKRVSEPQLEQVHRNGRPDSRTRSLGWAGRDLDLIDSGRNRRARKVFDVVNSVVDATFREYCAFDSLCGDELSIMVDCPEFLYHAKANWHWLLLKNLGQARIGGKIRKLTFRLVKREVRDRNGLRFMPVES